MSRTDRMRGAFYGVAVGDALGASVEFMTAEEIKRKHGTVREMIGGGWLNVVPGEITDDTQMTLCVAHGIVEAPDDPVQAVGRYFVRWYNGFPKDVGGTCASSIGRAVQLAKNKAEPTEKNWKDAGRDTLRMSGGRGAGNGSLMRSVYPAIYYADAKQAADTAGKISAMTHADERTVEACRDYVLLIHAMIAEEDFGKRRELLEANCREHECDGENFTPRPTGYVIDSHQAALWSVFMTDSFEEALVRCINLGGDADTVGAIAGGIAGALYGVDAIPERWLKTLSKKDSDEIDGLLAASNRG